MISDWFTNETLDFLIWIGITRIFTGLGLPSHSFANTTIPAYGFREPTPDEFNMKFGGWLRLPETRKKLFENTVHEYAGRGHDCKLCIMGCHAERQHFASECSPQDEKGFYLI